MLLLTKVTLLFLAALAALAASKRSAAAIRHLLCFCALAGSLLLPITNLFPTHVIAVRLPLISTFAVSPGVTQTAIWSPYSLLAGIWAFGCFVVIVRLAVGHWRTRKLVRSATPTELSDVSTADVNVPIVCGVFRPMVLMPRSAAEWPAWQVEAAVRHERMHIQRGDLRTNLIAQLACAVWWFHPLTWLLYRYLHDCQETACDDAVLFSGFEPATYAEALIAVARTPASTLLLEGCPMTTQMNLKTRITRLLDRSVARTASRANLLRTVCAFAIVLCAIGVLSLQRSSAQGTPAEKSEKVYRVGDGVTSPHPLYKIEPQYTEEARAAKINGSVLLSLVIGTDGLAHDISVIKGLDAGLDRNAAEAVQKWHFAPGTLNGEPVAVQATIEVNFRLL